MKLAKVMEWNGNARRGGGGLSSPFIRFVCGKANEKLFVKIKRLYEILAEK